MGKLIQVAVPNVADDLEPDFGSDRLNHWYCYTSSEAVADVIAVLTGGISNLCEQSHKNLL
jgi:hypothetical protein